MERQHALLNASSSNIWLECTRAARFAERFPKSVSDYALEGELCHSIATDLLFYRLKQMTKRVYLAKLAEHREHRLYDKEMDGYAEGFVNYVLEIYHTVKQNGWADIWIETRVDYGHIAPEGFGHLDVGILSSGRIDVIDLKYGKGVPVSAIVNPQLGLYAVGLIKAVEVIGEEFKDLHLHIYQPRIDNISVFHTTVKDCLHWAEGTVKRKAALAFKGEGDFVPGKHCRFCAALPKCKAAANRVGELNKYEQKLPWELSNEEIADALLLGELLDIWLTSIKDYSNAEARKGQKFPGFKLVRGKSDRRYIKDSDYEISQTLIKKGHTPEDIFVTKLKGIGEMERLLGPDGFKKLLGKFVEKPEGAPTLVPETDKRPAINGKDGILKAFKDIKI